ncbi:uncharacterized protein [Spinacia oleracea]|uniref:Reverse transcriptase domain-containing protein n=1 Tax=Spinacia oleracea TaxID=3562 RepID=A0A9R0HR32_SPIOL|nr:uncharacterized protein LOC110775057 [Spinacia oleracea]
MNYLADHTTFVGLVTDSWNMEDRGHLMEQIWCKLVRIKNKLKSLHKEEFAHAAEKIEHYRGELDSVQTQLRVCGSSHLLAAEIDLVCKLKKWLGIEEQALKQKSRVQWLKQLSKQKLEFFTGNSWGQLLYHSLALTCLLSEMVFCSLLRHELPCKTWSILKKDIYAAVFDFFNAGGVLGKFNCTSVTLVPKIPSPTSVSHFRPISCCTTVYKIVSKVLIARLQKVVAEVVYEYQAGFVPRRSISDNIIVATELIKGYNRAHMSPRCMVKVNLRKAYDSVEWPFLFMILQELGFPPLFIHWIKGCVTTVSYSILVNGNPMPPFAAKKDLRQGDPLSPFLFAICMEYLSRCMKSLVSNPDFNFHPKCEKLQLTHLMFADDLLLFARGDLISLQLIFKAFTCFSKASGLEANMDKTEVYFSGVHPIEQQAIMEALGITKGSLPFRYLGVPLSSSKLTIGQCKPLIDKFYTRVTSWVSKKLSYAGRLQLVKVILFSLQTYWSQIFMLPKKVVREIERICRTYLWTGDTKTSKKSPIAWDSVCKPKVAGGQNVKNFHLWNKAAILKLLWALAFKPDALWVKWVNAYYVKGKDMYTMPIPASASWMIKKIWSSRDLLDTHGDCKQVFLAAGKFSIRKMYSALTGILPKVAWRRLICNNRASPKSLFILWLAVQSRLPTKDRLQNWGIPTDGLCPLCSTDLETVQHLFFQCSYSQQVWQQVLQVLKIQRPSFGFDQEIQIAVRMCKRSSGTSKLFIAVFAEVVYGLWIQRKQRVFAGHSQVPDHIVRAAIFRVACRCKESDLHLLLY